VQCRGCKVISLPTAPCLPACLPAWPAHRATLPYLITSNGAEITGHSSWSLRDCKHDGVTFFTAPGPNRRPTGTGARALLGSPQFASRITATNPRRCLTSRDVRAALQLGSSSNVLLSAAAPKCLGPTCRPSTTLQSDLDHFARFSPFARLPSDAVGWHPTAVVANHRPETRFVCCPRTKPPKTCPRVLTSLFLPLPSFFHPTPCRSCALSASSQSQALLDSTTLKKCRSWDRSLGNRERETESRSLDFAFFEKLDEFFQIVRSLSKAF
jgi:hypothetical protein